MDEKETVERLTKVEERSKSNTHTMSKTMIQLVEEVKHTNETVSALDIKVDRMDNRVDDIERAPADNLNTYKRTAITAMISTVAGALATGLIFIIAQVI